MGIALCILAFGLGHLVRDGWPTLNTTQGARILGAVFCTMGAFLLHHDAIDGAVVGVAVLAGFYLDMKHGDGAGADSLKSIEDLALSGLTSVAPMAAAIAVYHETPWAAVLLAAAVVKPLIWWSMWRIRPDRISSWAEPTRISAITFGLLFGAAVAALV